MKAIRDLIISFSIAPVQFIIGVFLVVGKADVKTIGWYYVLSSSFMVFVSLVAVILLAIKGTKGTGE